MADERYEEDVFICLNETCGKTQHWWGRPLWTGNSQPNEYPDEWAVARCSACYSWSLWVNQELAWPAEEFSGPAPHPDMPGEVLALFNEARQVAATSRRSAGALLRLALQVLVDGLVPGDASLDKKIGTLVSQGLHPDAQKAMDVLRVVGNNAVHPGQISLEEDDGLVPALFSMLNLVVEQVIERPKQVASLFESLPEGAKEAIVRRDGAAPA